MRHERSIQLIPDDLGSIDPNALRALEAVTPATLGQHDVLGSRCGLCKHEGRIDRLELVRRWPDTSFMELERRLSCRHCRNKNNNKFVISRAPRD